MTPACQRLVTDWLMLEEAVRPFPYDDKTGHAPAASGKITIGIGRNLTDVGLSIDEINYLFTNDLKRAEVAVRQLLTDRIFDALSVNRQAVVLDMAFNLGLFRFSQFHDTICSIKQGLFEEAALHMRNSVWFKQVGPRAEHLATQMAQG